MPLWQIFQPPASRRKTSTSRAMRRDRKWSWMGRWILKKEVATATSGPSAWIFESKSSSRIGSVTWAKSWRVMATHSARSFTRKSPPPV